MSPTRDRTIWLFNKLSNITFAFHINVLVSVCVCNVLLGSAHVIDLGLFEAHVVTQRLLGHADAIVGKAH